jgi:hypothetical protein
MQRFNDLVLEIASQDESAICSKLFDEASKSRLE